MTPEQRTQLEVGRAASRQRWLAGRYLAALGAESQAALSQSRVIIRPESDAALCYRMFDERGLVLDKVTRPLGYKFFAFSRPEEVLAQVAAFGTAADETIGDFCPTYFIARQDGDWLPSGELPIFEVWFGWARAHFPELYAATLQGCNLTTRCGRAGILTRMVSGYSDRNADESVFELACWGGEFEAESGPKANLAS